MGVMKLGQIQEKRVWEPTLVFDVVDSFARYGDLGTAATTAPRSTAGWNPRPVGSIVIEAVARVINGQRMEYAQPLRLILQQSPSGYFLFYGRVQRSKGVIQRDLLQPGIYDLRLTSDYYLTADLKDVVIPMPDLKQALRIELIPIPAYPFPPYVKLLRGTVLDTDGKGLAGVIVTTDLYPNLKYVTIESGDWVLALPMLLQDTPAQDIRVITLQFAMPDGTTTDEVISYSYKRGECVTVLMGQIVDGANKGIPKVTVEVPNQPGSVRTDAEGKWTYVFQYVEPNQSVDAIITERKVQGQNDPVRQRQELDPAIPIHVGQPAYVPVLQIP